MLPLYVFEERYRLMLDYCLEHGRIFSVAMRIDGSDEEDNFEGIAPCATAGMIRACVRNPDGTSHLLLQGLHRHRILSWQQTRPFPIADVEWIQTTNRDHPEVAELAAQLVEASRRFAAEEMTEQMEEHILSLDDPEAIGDIIAYNCIRDPQLLLPILAEQDLLKRLEIVCAELKSSQRGKADDT